MISFYPGPSRVHDEIPEYVTEAMQQGVLSMNHRSAEFVKISMRTVTLLKQKLNIPKSYSVFYTSSATECWEIIAQSLISTKSYHFYNGAFGQKWFDYTKRICPEAESIIFDKDVKLDSNASLDIIQNSLVCLTQNETSNGTQINSASLKVFRKKNPTSLIAVDATSSMAGISLDFNQADIWFASVQKCFGLPAGLAILICSPKAIERAKSIGEKSHYNSLLHMIEMMEKWQTTHTPNVLGIYLLMRTLESMKPIKQVQEKTIERFKLWEVFFKDFTGMKLLIKNREVRSLTVLTLEAKPDLVEFIKTKAKSKGFLLGEGYGELKKTTFRIANFPATKSKEITMLQKFLKSIEKA